MCQLIETFDVCDGPRFPRQPVDWSENEKGWRASEEQQAADDRRHDTARVVGTSLVELELELEEPSERQGDGADASSIKAFDYTCVPRLKHG